MNIKKEVINNNIENIGEEIENKTNSYKNNKMIYSKYNSNKENNGDNNNNKDNKNKKKKLCPAEDIIKTQNKIIQNRKENIAKNKKPLSLFTQDLFSKHYKHKNNEKKDTKLSLGEIISKKILINASITKKGNKYFGEQKNQDSLFKVKFSDINFSFYGVCDGHGKNGHLVSDFIKINL